MTETALEYLSADVATNFSHVLADESLTFLFKFIFFYFDRFIGHTKYDKTEGLPQPHAEHGKPLAFYDNVSSQWSDSDPGDMCEKSLARYVEGFW